MSEQAERKPPQKSMTRKRVTAEDKARAAKRLEMVMRLQIAREQVAEVWRDAACPADMEGGLRQTERALMAFGEQLRDSA